MLQQYCAITDNLEYFLLCGFAINLSATYFWNIKVASKTLDWKGKILSNTCVEI